MEKGCRYHLAGSAVEYSDGMLKLPLLVQLQVAGGGTQSIYKGI